MSDANPVEFAWQVDLSKAVLTEHEWDLVCDENLDFAKGETPNEPWPLRAQSPLGKNRAFGYRVDNRGYTSAGGIYVPDTTLHINKPHAMRLVKLSEVIDEDEYPAFAKIRRENPDPSKVIRKGPFVLYAQNAEYSIGNYVIVPLSACYFTFSPIDLTDDQGDSVRKGWDAYKQSIADIKSNPPSPGTRIVIK